MESQINGEDLTPKSITIGEHRFRYRVEPVTRSVYLWATPGNFGDPFQHMETIERAANEIRNAERATRVFFSAASAPEHFDHTGDDDRIACFNQRVIEALVALGARKDEAEAIFDYVGMPSEWRGAMWNAASMAERLPQRTDAHVNLTQRIATVCRFMAITMTVDGSFKWSLAVGNRVLKDAVEEYKEALGLGSESSMTAQSTRYSGPAEPPRVPSSLIDDAVATAWIYLSDPDIENATTLAIAIKFNANIAHLESFDIADLWEAIERRRRER